MTIEEKIQHYKSCINAELDGFYTTGPISLTKTIQYVINGGGKRVRPILTLLTADACGGDPQKALPAALSIELLHNFTLVHDDIMDQDNLRRGKKTVHHKWGVSTAILTGDGMLSIALNNIQKNYNKNSEIPGIFIEGLLAVCEGQALDKEFESLDNINVEQYIKMIDLKTGYLLGMSSEIGAKTTKIDLKTSKKLMEYGRLIGRAFQIQDDLMEIFSNTSKMGKNLGSDIILKKKTYLMVLAQQLCKNKIDSAIRITRSDLSSGLKEIRKILLETGIKKQVESIIDKTILTANNSLKSLNIKIDNLLYFSNLISKRRN